MVLVVPEQSQRPYRFGMTLLCVGALFNWLGLADTYSDPVPAIRYIGVGLIAAGASLICMAMCFWMRNIHEPNLSGEYDIPSDPAHAIDHTLEKPPDYSTVVDVPPCYEDAIKLSPAALASVHNYKESPSIFVQPSLQSGADGSDKIIISTITERCHSYRSCQSNDSVDCSVEPTECRRTEKCETGNHLSVPNSSQNENALTKVLRKSIRGIRKFRNNEESGCSEQSSSMENGNIHNASSSSPSKVDR